MQHNEEDIEIQYEPSEMRKVPIVSEEEFKKSTIELIHSEDNETETLNKYIAKFAVIKTIILFIVMLILLFFFFVKKR